MQIVIVDYGMGNLRSVEKSFIRLGTNAIVSSDLKIIEKADKLVLPGVGHFNIGINNLKKRGMYHLLTDLVLIKKVPVLGICLGMQLMTKYSEEGGCEGLSWVDAETTKFKNTENRIRLKIPHMGWNTLSFNKHHVILKNLIEDDQFYFVHSYKVLCKNGSDVLTSTLYNEYFHSSFLKENILGVQFHPEKSFSRGMSLIKNFIEWNPNV